MKERLFTRYYETTVQIMELLKGHRWEDAVKLLDERDELIASIDGNKEELSSSIQTIIKRTLELENRIRQLLEEERQEAIRGIQSLRREKRVSQYYGQHAMLHEGLFYDTRK
jgi:hypothetical protein